MKEVFIVDAKRTPQVKAGLDLKEIPPIHLGIGLVRNLLDGANLGNDEIDEVIIGNTGTPAKYANISRVIALEAGLNKKTSAYTVHRNCASGMEALSQGYLKIASGRSDLIMAGGVECMSQLPLIYNKDMTNFFIDLMTSKTAGKKIKTIGSFRPGHLAPVIAVQLGLTDPVSGMNMGNTAEKLAYEIGITRLQQDQTANESHMRAIKAIEAGHFQDEIVPVAYGKKLDKILYNDVGPRATSTVEKLGKLKPFFDKKSGTVTVGNSCPLTDAGSMILLASEEAVKKHNLNPMARMVDYHFHGLEPERMGMGPLVASHGVFKRTGLGVKDMEYFEINEAFAAQVLAVYAAFKEKKISERFGIYEPMGEIPMDRCNIYGSGIALGHPVGSTGSRIVVTLAHILKRNKAKYGLASLCIGGGQGGAVIVENLHV